MSSDLERIQEEFPSDFKRQGRIIGQNIKFEFKKGAEAAPHLKTCVTTIAKGRECRIKNFSEADYLRKKTIYSFIFATRQSAWVLI